MSVSLSFGTRCFIVSESRLKHIISQEKEQATHLGLWDKIKEYFRSEKKQDVLNELYNLIHQNDSSTSQTLKGRIETFNKIKQMADPVFQNSFRVENYPGEDNIKFFAGETVLYRQPRDTLSAEDQQFFTGYNMAEINADEGLRLDFLAGVQKYLDGELSVQGDPAGGQLFNDICRGSYSFDGFTISADDDVAAEEKKQRLTSFLEKLTPQQKKGLNVAGSQIGAIALIDTLLSRESQVVLLGNPDKQTKYNFDESNGELKVHIMIQQNLNNERFEVLRENHGQKNAHWYDGISLEATFTLAKKGSINCTDFYFSIRCTSSDLI